MSNPPVTTDQFSAIHLFRELSEPQLERMRRVARRHRLDAGEVLFEHGTHANRFFYLVGGRIVLKRVSIEGDEKIIELVRPGQTFAEAIMFMGQQTYPVTAAAIESSELLSFENATFKALLHESTETCFRLMADLSRRLRRWVNEVDALTLQNATCRTVNFLLYQIPEGSTSPVTILLPGPKHIIASRLSMKPETFSRILRELVDEELILVDGLTIRVADIKALTRHVQI